MESHKDVLPRERFHERKFIDGSRIFHEFSKRYTVKLVIWFCFSGRGALQKSSPEKCRTAALESFSAGLQLACLKKEIPIKKYYIKSSNVTFYEKHHHSFFS